MTLSGLVDPAGARLGNGRWRTYLIVSGGCSLAEFSGIRSGATGFGKARGRVAVGPFQAQQEAE